MTQPAEAVPDHAAGERVPTPVGRLAARIAAAFATTFSLDVRALALFRIGLGLVVVIDAITRLLDVELFYSSLGIFPQRGGFTTISQWLHRPSLYVFSDSVEFASALLVLTAVAGVLLCIGFSTRAAAFVAWLLELSIQHRSPLLNTGADQVLIGALFIGMFLPLARHYAFDAARSKTAVARARATTVLSGATVAVIIQLVLIYVFNYLQKDGDGWLDGRAVLQALHIDHHTTAIGIFVRERMAWLSAPLTYATLIIEGGVLLLLFPFPRFRVLLFALMWGMHIGFALTMQLGLFSLNCMVLWLAVLPPSALDWLARRFALLRWLRAPDDASPAEAAHARSAVRTRGASVRQAVALVPLIVIGLQAWANEAALKKTGMPSIASRVPRALQMHLAWRMFGNPSRNDGWWVIPGTYADGHVGDLFRDGVVKPKFDKPTNVGKTYRTSRWRKLMMHTAQVDVGASLRKQHAQWYCDRAKRSPVYSAELVRVDMVFIEERTREDFKKRTPKRLDLLQYDCRSRRALAPTTTAKTPASTPAPAAPRAAAPVAPAADDAQKQNVE